MVRVSETEKLTGDAELFARYFRRLLDSKGITQDQVADKLNRARSYVNYRYKGYKSWTVNEVNTLAPLAGCDDVFEVVRKVHGMIQADEAEKAKPQPEARPSVAVSSPDEVEDVLRRVRKGDYTTAAWDEDERTKEYYESEHDDD